MPKKEDVLTVLSIILAGASSWGVHSLVGSTPPGFIIFLTISFFLVFALVLNHGTLAHKSNALLHIGMWILLAGANAMAARAYLGTLGVYIGIAITIIFCAGSIWFWSKRTITVKAKTPHVEVTEKSSGKSGKDSLRSTLSVEDPDDPNHEGLVDTTHLFEQSKARTAADKAIAEAQLMNAQNQIHTTQLALVEQLRKAVQRGEMDEDEGNSRITNILRTLAPMEVEEMEEKIPEPTHVEGDGIGLPDETWGSLRQRQKRK